MDSLSALSVVAAVIQFVDFGQRLFVGTWSIYRSASGESMVLGDLSTVPRDLEQLSTSVERALEHTQGRENGPSMSQYADESLLRACAECRAMSSDIQNILLEIGHSFQPMAVANKKLAKKGGFLWISLVTQTMLQALIEGSSLSQLRAILNTMPAEIEKLYDAIYESIPKNLLPEVSIMLQIYHSACGPVNWLTLWLADESRGTKLEFKLKKIDIEQVYFLLKRRLGTRTRGILGLVGATKNVEYLHRAASEWIGQPRVLERLRCECPSNFDPCLSLLRAETLQLEHFRVPKFAIDDDHFWKRIMRSLMYASLVDGAIIPDKTLNDVVNDFRRAAHKSASTVRQEEESRPTFGDGWLTHEYLAEVRRVLKEHRATAKKRNVFQVLKWDWKRIRAKS
ncbi:hypothetical protein N3K66_008624 [Trichothecium roseum]|uniref:Uncharacterized protein n=1 Tax=Trichothecium roseum TaxID=47278 RepID=A0ACC0UR79_9HYPO|nr:hypothetical protein N3K66_008624 [Trichothecium roseum]